MLPRWLGRPPVGLLALVAAAVAFRQLLLPVATEPDAPDARFGLAEVVWLVLCQLLPLGWRCCCAPR